MAMLPVLVEGARELGLELSPQQLGQFQRFYEVLTEWAERVSLTAVRDEEGIQRRHFLESAALVAVLREEGLSLRDRLLIDIGSGAGIPGIPLKILEPSLRLTLVEAKQRKSEFLNALLPELGMNDVLVLSRRSEEVVELGSYCTVFTATEVLEKIRAGKKVPDIVKGLFLSVVKRDRKSVV